MLWHVFGMILASIFLIFKKIDKWEKSVIFFCFRIYIWFVTKLYKSHDRKLIIYSLSFLWHRKCLGMTIPGLSGSFTFDHGKL